MTGQTHTPAPLTVVTGKGGTGKTTVAAALGLAAAGAGRRTIVCEVSRQQRLPGLFGVRTPRLGEELEVQDGLWITSIDAHSALEEWLARQLPRRLVQVLARSGGFSAFVGAAPGARELVTMTKAWELAQPERWRRDARRYDAVVLDAPASGHGLGLLRTPHTFAEIARVGPIASQARRVDEALRDPALTACVAVALPGELPVSETLELEHTLRERLGRDFDAIVVNGVAPRRVSPAEAERLAGRDGALPAPAVHAARAAAARGRVQQGQLARLRRHARAPVHQLPFVFTERLALDDVRRLATRLDRAIPHQ
jgi:anion-transporting  ArsA/GET3 family ATPase